MPGTRFRSVLPCLVVCCLAGLSVGCGEDDGPAVVPVSGRLTLDGKPLAGVRIRFIPDESHVQGETAFADTDDDGRFDITTKKPGDGIVPGTYKVDVNAPSPIALPPDPSDSAGAREAFNMASKMNVSQPFPDKYRDTETSGLSFTIEGGKPLEIDLKP